MAAIKNFKKYTFSLDEQGMIIVTNAKGQPVQAGPSGYRLTNDEGQRVAKSAQWLADNAGLLFPNELDSIKPEEVHEEKLEQIPETIDGGAKLIIETPNEPKKPAVPRKLSLEQAKEIIKKIADGNKQSFIAKEYNVHQSTISDIKAGRLYPEAAVGRQEKEIFSKATEVANIPNSEVFGG